MNWNISVACSRLSVSEDQPNSKWTTNDGCGCRGNDLQTECLLTLSVSLFVFLIKKKLLFSSRFPWMWPWFITLALCWWIPCDCSELNKNWNASKVITVNGTNEHLPCSRVLRFYFILGFKISFNKKKPPDNIFIYVFQRRAQMIFFFITFKGAYRGGNERF